MEREVQCVVRAVMWYLLCSVGVVEVDVEVVGARYVLVNPSRVQHRLEYVGGS